MNEEVTRPVRKVGELINLSGELTEYYVYIMKIIQHESLTKEKQKRADQLFRIIGYKSGSLGKLITDLTNEEKINVSGTPYNMWTVALRIPPDSLSLSAVGFCIQIVNRAIGLLEEDIKRGKRDPNTGERIGIISTKTDTSIKPKAFIAHEGETRALAILKEFLEALEIQYFIAESKASDGRSIERQVDWTQTKADFAICLATKGKAINKKTGKHYMAPNIIDELGRARQVFGNKIILLVQKGVEVHTNIREIVYETFTTTNMERAFIKVAKELTNWGFITAGTIKEQT